MPHDSRAQIRHDHLHVELFQQHWSQLCQYVLCDDKWLNGTKVACIYGCNCTTPTICHDDIEGNENADTLAKKARYKHQAAAAVDYKTIKSRHERELNKSWRDSVDHSQWNIRRSTEGEFTRQERTTLAQIRTGHCTLLKAYRKRIGLEDDGTCETCQREEEDREHVMGRCPAWSQDQRETFRKPFLSHRELIKAEPENVIAFLRRIGRLPAKDST